MAQLRTVETPTRAQISGVAAVRSLRSSRPEQKQCCTTFAPLVLPTAEMDQNQ